MCWNRVLDSVGQPRQALENRNEKARMSEEHPRFFSSLEENRHQTAPKGARSRNGCRKVAASLPKPGREAANIVGLPGFFIVPPSIDTIFLFCMGL